MNNCARGPCDVYIDVCIYSVCRIKKGNLIVKEFLQMSSLNQIFVGSIPILALVLLLFTILNCFHQRRNGNQAKYSHFQRPNVNDKRSAYVAAFPPPVAARCSQINPPWLVHIPRQWERVCSSPKMHWSGIRLATWQIQVTVSSLDLVLVKSELLEIFWLQD